MLLGVALGGVPNAAASVSFQRTDVALPAAPESVAIGDLDGKDGKDIAVALSSPGSVGVLLNHGDGTFAPMQQYTAGPQCASLAVDITLGDVTQPAPGNRLLPDGKLDAYVACTPYVVRLTGDGAGALGNPEPINLGVQQYLGPQTLDLLTLMRRPDANPAPLLVLQHAVGSFGRELCISYELDPGQLVCNDTPVQGPLAVGDLNGSAAGVPPDEVLSSEGGGGKLAIFGFPPMFPLSWTESSRTVPGGVESIALGDVDTDDDLDVVVGQSINSAAARADSIHSFKLNPSGSGGLEQVPTTLPSTPGVDAVAVADVDGDACNDVIAGGSYGTGMVHLGDGAGGFDGGQDLPQLGYHNPATATRVTMAVDDLTGDGHPDVVIADQGRSAVMVFRNNSSPSSAACAADGAPTAHDDVAVVAENAPPATVDVLANDTDPDGGPKLVASVTQPAHGTATIGGGGVTYKPAAGYCNDLGGSPDSFTYTLNGGSVATVAVTVQCVDEAPPMGGGPSLPPPPPPPPAPRTCANPGVTQFTVGTPGDDVLVGTGGLDVLSGRGGDDCLFGRANDDRLTGGTGADLLDGSSGGDRMRGDAGNDKLRGGRGNDDITPGAGKDTVAAQGGDDVISARDGTRDTIDCGAGRDKVTADRTDTVKNCEFVKRAVRRARRRH
jgi:Ca2+-binding RTX toxin-like protein